MYIKRIFTLCAALALSGCVATKSGFDAGMYGALDSDTPITLPDVSHMSSTTKTHKIAALLPLTGDNASAGRAVGAAITAATLHNAPETLSVSFYDTATDVNLAIENAKNNGAEIFIGPIFANNARAVRGASRIPTLAFTSDVAAIGDNVYSVSLLPTASVDAITAQMATDNVKDFIILAPNNPSGRLMAGAARNGADNHDMNIAGIFFYDEGGTDSIKSAVATASMHAARNAANNRAREILADILTDERLTAIERSNMERQLERVSKQETMGELPYRAILLLGGGSDAKTIASFLRYYGVTARDATIYGTALWDGSDDALYDFTLSGARFAALPEMSAGFTETYAKITDTTPSRLAAFGYDATNIAIGILYSGGGDIDYLTQSRGFIGTNGLVRFDDDGLNHRALRILELNGTASPRVVAAAQTTFADTPDITNPHDVSSADPRDLANATVNPLDFINIPSRLRGKYKGENYQSDMIHPDNKPAATDTVTTLPEDDGSVVETPEFESVKSESVSRTFIDSVEIEE